MRIIAGKYRSRPLLSPRDAETTRPIPDRVKESVFSILRGHFEGASVLDCFAGTGSIGLEALSRGAERVVLVERDRRIADLLATNIERLGSEAVEACELVVADALGPAAISRCPRPADLIFMDPPYPLVWEHDGWERVKRQVSRLAQNLTDTGFLVLRTPWPFRHVTVTDENERLVPAGDPRNPYDARGVLREDRPPSSGKQFQGRRVRVENDEDDDGGDREWIGDEIDLAAIQAMTDRAKERADLGPKAEGFTIHRQDVSLKIDGAIGPETHDYASQAVHLYMKDRDARPEAAGT